MNSQDLRVVWYRFRATFGRRRGGYLAIVLLVGLVGGIAMASIAGARRTQSSYPSFLASTNASDLSVSSFVINNSNQASLSSSAGFVSDVARLGGVKRVRTLAFFNGAALGRDGAPLDVSAQLIMAGSTDGLYRAQDRVTVLHGRMADPTRTDEAVLTADAAHALKVRLGQVVPFGFYSSEQSAQPGFGTASVPPKVRVEVKVVGIVAINTQVVQDDIDRFPAFMLFTPALTRQLLPDSTVGYYGLKLAHGSRDALEVERAFVRILPPGTTYQFHLTSHVEAQVERSVKPEAIALGVFGSIAALAALLIAVQAVSRQLRAGDDDLAVLRALGAGPTTTAGDALIGTLAAIVIGSLVAMAVAVGLSPLAPLGPVRNVYPHAGIAFDWTVLGVGLLVMVGGLGAVAVALAYRGAPHRVARRARLAPARSSSVVRLAASSGLSAPAVVGVGFALEPGRGQTAVPVRSALLGTVLAVVMVVATLTFGASLHALVSRPSLYGWDWDYAVNPTNSVPPQTRALLDHDPAVAAWAGFDSANAQLDSQNVPILLGDARAKLSPPILSGHALEGPNQVVLGAATLARLHKHVGDSVVVSYGAPQDAPVYVPPTRLRIVGTATMPAVGFPSIIADHVSMGTGALIPLSIEPPAFQEALRNPDPTLDGPSLAFVRLRTGVSRSARLAAVRRIKDVTQKAWAADPNAVGNTVSVLTVRHPAEIVNYRSTGATPAILALGLAAGAVVALGLTLTASVRRRGRDLALLKTLGFTQRQLAAAVAWQASVAAVIGIAVGVRLGVAIGRQLWILFARNIYAVPAPTVPVLSAILVGVGALVFANVVAALPGRIAARTPTAVVLRTE